MFHNMFKFLWRGVFRNSPKPSSCTTTPCRLSATPYILYSQLPSISGGRSSIRNLRTRHAVVTGTHLSRCHAVVTGTHLSRCHAVVTGTHLSRCHAVVTGTHLSRATYLIDQLLLRCVRGWACNLNVEKRSCV
jgi:hypothetical protein